MSNESGRDDPIAEVELFGAIIFHSDVTDQSELLLLLHGITSVGYCPNGLCVLRVHVCMP